VLARDRVARIDAAVVSHANSDHYCGLPDLAEHRPVGSLLSSPYFFRAARSPGATGRLVAEMRRLGVRTAILARGDRLGGTGQVSVDVLWPPENLPAKTKANDTSVVLRLEYAGRRILLCGDIESLPQQALVDSTDLKAEVLVLPHHGSPLHLTREFLHAVDPIICICSTGRRDSESPNGVRSSMAGRHYYNTADVGAVTVCISPTAIRVYCGPDESPVCTLSIR
jgi:competence protein ComEC